MTLKTKPLKTIRQCDQLLCKVVELHRVHRMSVMGGGPSAQSPYQPSVQISFITQEDNKIEDDNKIEAIRLFKSSPHPLLINRIMDDLHKPQFVFCAISPHSIFRSYKYLPISILNASNDPVLTLAKAVNSRDSTPSARSSIYRPQF